MEPRRQKKYDKKMRRFNALRRMMEADFALLPDENLSEELRELKKKGAVLLCPLCLHIYIDGTAHDPESLELSEEHNPPKTLEGKPALLTCKQCNSTAGAQLDGKVTRFTEEMSFFRGVEGGNIQAQLIADGRPYKFTAELKEENRVLFSIHSGWTKEHSTHLEKYFESQPRSLQIHVPSKHRNAGFKSMLKVGYLEAFLYFGYDFATHASADYLSDVISGRVDPIPMHGVLQLTYQGITTGLHYAILNDVRCFLVVFRAKSLYTNTLYGVMIPGATPEALEEYRSFKHDGDGFQVLLKEIPKTKLGREPFNRHEYQSHWHLATQYFTKEQLMKGMEDAPSL